MDVAVEIQEALIRRLGAERYALWFSQGVSLEATAEALTVTALSEFVVERLRKRMLGELQAAAREVLGRSIAVRLRVEERDATVTAEESDDPAAESTGEAAHAAPSNRSGRLPLPDHRTAAAKRPGGRQANAGARRANAQNPNVRGRAGRARGDAQPTIPSVALRPAHPLRMVSDDHPPASNDGEESNGGRSASANATAATFCVGDCNRLAFTATKMAIEEPGSASPLFFWGPAGTGKTHLLSAIRNELRRRHGLRRVVLLSAEQFTNDFTGAVRGSGLPGFRRRYRDVDALLIDDVQFVGGKRATLRELLYTVDSLLRGRCQLAFTADRPPLELEGLSDELAGRMAGGMVCALRPLDRDTRRNVLRSMAAASGAEVSDEVLDMLADSLAGDARILSGAINHLRTLGQMLGRPASWSELQQSASELLAAGRPAVNLGDIQKAVCDMFGLPSGSLRSRGQQRSVSQPRMLAMYLARQYTRAAYSEIGDYFGNRSHSTVIAATKRVEDWIADSTPLRRGATSLQPRQAIEAIENLLRTG